MTSGGENIFGITGETKSYEIITFPIKIGEIEENFSFYIVKSNSFKEDLLLGLDLIKKFRLCQNVDLVIVQNLNSKETKRSIITVNNLNATQADEMKDIRHRNGDIFAKTKFDVGTIKNHTATLKLSEPKYISRKPYKCSFEDKAEIEIQIKELLKTGLVEESCSPFSAPVTLAYKKDDEKRTRLCIDYRELNKIVIPESQPFPKIDDLTVRVIDCKYFTKLDINSAFWSVPLRSKDRYKTSFVTHHGHWQWSCLPFGLKSLPAIFQQIFRP